MPTPGCHRKCPSRSLYSGKWAHASLSAVQTPICPSPLRPAQAAAHPTGRLTGEPLPDTEGSRGQHAGPLVSGRGRGGGTRGDIRLSPPCPWAELQDWGLRESPVGKGDAPLPELPASSLGVRPSPAGSFSCTRVSWGIVAARLWQRKVLDIGPGVGGDDRVLSCL